MPSYLITGASKGIGYEFVRQISQDPKAVVIGLVRDKAATEKKVAELSRSNIHILEGDLTNYDSLKAAVKATADLTGGSLDYVIANAGYISQYSDLRSFGELADKPEALEQDLIDTYKVNVIGNVHLINLFMPLILKGTAKKVIVISSGNADTELARKYEVDNGGPYAASKAAVNMVVAKFSAEYRKKGVLVLAICPGAVDSGWRTVPYTEAEGAKAMEMGGKFMAYSPEFKGPIPPEESVKAVLQVIESKSVENGDGGDYVSHFGNKKWI